MRKYLPVIILLSINIFATDNEISIDQAGATANIDIEQLGSGNLIGGATAISGTMTALDLDGATMTLDVNQLGNSNIFKGDIYADSYTGFFEFTGDSNTFAIQTDPNNTYGADSSNVNVQVSGSSNAFTFSQAIDLDLATIYMNIDGSDNTVTFDGDGYQGAYFHLTHTGGSRTINVTQQSTLDNDWLKITSNGSNGTFCVNQNDQGTSTGC